MRSVHDKFWIDSKHPAFLFGVMLPAAAGCASNFTKYICVEVGRITPEWFFDELHDSMKSDFGLSPRLMINNDIDRLDLVWSEDDAATWVMYGHPF
jgi:hypothetical protein